MQSCASNAHINPFTPPPMMMMMMMVMLVATMMMMMMLKSSFRLPTLFAVGGSPV